MYQVVTRVINVNQLITSIIPRHHHISPPPPHPAPHVNTYISEKLRESPFYPTTEPHTPMPEPNFIARFRNKLMYGHCTV